MRSLLGFLAFIAVVIGLVGAFLVPTIVAPMVAAAVREASPFGDQPLDVEVDVDAIGLLRGFVGEIRISGTDLEDDEVRIEDLAITVQGLRLDDRSFSAIEGGLQTVAVPLGGAEPLVVDRIALSGVSETVNATVQLDHDATLAFVTRTFADQGVEVRDIELIDGGVSVVIFEQRVPLAFAVADGALVIADLLGTGPMELLAPLPDDPWRLIAVTATLGGMELVASLDAARFLAGE